MSLVLMVVSLHTSLSFPGAQTSTVTSRPWRQQHLHCYHRQKAAQCAHRLRVLYQGEAQMNEVRWDWFLMRYYELSKDWHPVQLLCEEHLHAHVWVLMFWLIAVFLKWYNCCWTNTIVLISSVNSTSDDGDNGDASSGDDDISCLNLKNVHWQPNKGRGEMKELRMLCAEDEQGRTCWMTAFRLFKVTQRLKKMYYTVFDLFFLLSHSI